VQLPADHQQSTTHVSEPLVRFAATTNLALQDAARWGVKI